ncbi:MAG: isoprenylcysteine carboxylmethyltransferase family protein [Anaerolineae bacterium]|jgi:protein-S-isoprenylcysteine O-methyltransferase Ste14|nr:isoprenylcysteine carboxylmethyltransferase family protein [Anaerolineae bacterium]
MTRSQAYVSAQFALFAAIPIAAIVFPLGTSVLMRGIGVVLILIGVGVVMLAIGEHQRMNRQNPKVLPDPNVSAGLVETGVYRRVRHPIYSGVLVSVLGVALLHGHPVLFVIWIALIGVLNAKAAYEESLLQATYPTYSDYMARTGRFLPSWTSKSK